MPRIDLRWPAIGILTALLLVWSAPSRAVSIIDIGLVVESIDASQAVIGVDLTTPVEGLVAYSFSLAFDGSLTFASGDRITPPGMLAYGAFDHGGAGPGTITLIAAWSSTLTSPVGVGGQTFRVAELTFDLNGAGGNVQSGAFFSGVDGFAISAADVTGLRSFGGANVAGAGFGAARLGVVPEPGTALPVQLGLLLLAARRRRAQ